MEKLLSIMLAATLAMPVQAAEIENRGVVKIPSKEVVKATKRHEDIKEWKTVRAKKGYILSNDLYYQQLCTPTWDKHVKEFKKANPKVKNPNIISIDQIIQVQTCHSEEKAQELVKEETPAAPVAPKVEEVKAKEKSDFFVILSGQLNKSADGNGNRAGHGQGIKLEVGKYFKISEDRKIKASAGVLYNETSLDDVKEKTKKTTGTADVSYLFKVNDKMHIGPNLGILTSSGFGDAQKVLDDKISGFVGANLDYQLNDRLSLDLKVGNQLESRVNLNTTFGLQLNF